MIQQTTPDCSIVIPVYFNEGSLAHTYAALKEEVFEPNEETFETIFVDDGSGDDSLAELLNLKESEIGRIRVVKLADGQDSPKLINRMLAEFKGGAEIVIAARADREESRFRLLTSRIFYKLMRRLSFQNMPEGGFDFFLLGRRPLDVINRNQEAHPFLQGQVLWTGYRTKFFEYTRQARAVGKSRWSFGKKLTYLLDGVMSYSFLPIRLMSFAGGLVALSGFLYALVILIDRLVHGNPTTGWAPLMIVLLVVSGLQLLMLGLIGEYLWRTLAQGRGREPYVIDQIYE
jgi:dolichol-phosphate mannosyltransferase